MNKKYAGMTGLFVLLVFGGLWQAWYPTAESFPTGRTGICSSGRSGTRIRCFPENTSPSMRTISMISFLRGML